jgi:hypothetical protein
MEMWRCCWKLLFGFLAALGREKALDAKKINILLDNPF